MEINGDLSTDRFNFLLEGDNLHSLQETQFLTFLLAPARLLKQSWNGNDCYGYEDISSHDNSFYYSIEEIYVGDHVYYSDDNGGYTRYVRNEPKGHEAKYNLPEAFRNAKNLSFIFN